MRLAVPEQCARYICWQRFARVEDPQEVRARYGDAVAAEFDQMLPHLPPRVETILGIGCGMAGLEVLLARHYRARLELLDGDEANLNPDVPHEVGIGGWNETLKPYNSRRHTELLACENGVTIDRWHDVGTRKTLRADLIVSLWSLGFHYPLDTYRIEGLCLTDLRRGREQARGLLIASGSKHVRCLFTARAA